MQCTKTGRCYMSRKPGMKKSSRTLFQDKVLKMLKSLNFKVFGDFGNVNERKIPILGALCENNIDTLKEKLLSNGFKIFNINTLHYKGIYFKEDSYQSGLFIAPKNDFVSLDQSILNQARETLLVFEFQEFGKKNNMEFLTSMDESSYIPLWQADADLIAYEMGITPLFLGFINYKNSNQEFIKKYLYFKNADDICLIKQEEYNNIEKFSLLYYMEIKVMANLLRHKSISVHDAGTNNAHFPLLLSRLSENELFGLNIATIYASDISGIASTGVRGERLVKMMLGKSLPYKPFKFLKIDLTKELNTAPSTDVIILNDVLEHLENDSTAFSVLKLLWEKTEKLLIVHVPFENKPNPSWGHRITFNKNKLKKWASLLTDAQNLSEKYYEFHTCTLASLGFLILSRDIL